MSAFQVNDIVNVFTEDDLDHLGQNALILCCYTGSTAPLFCEPMARKPSPKVGVYFDASFVERLNRALTANPSIHDGAVLLGRSISTSRYRITGWSYRLFPPSKEVVEFPNRGSAFNTCQRMAMVDRVDGLLLLSGKERWLFEGASAKRVADP